MKRVRANYTGRVQGVGFRYTACEAASKHEITGWVKNLPDGRVEVVAEGTEATLENFLNDLRGQMSHHIHEEKINWAPATGEFASFQMNY